MVSSEIQVMILTRDLWDTARTLSVYPHQLQAVATVSEALILVKKSSSKNPYIPLGVFFGKELIGFLVLLCDTTSDSNFWISRFFIDKRFQKRGFGFQAIPLIIALLKKLFPNAKRLSLCVHPNNLPARALYKKRGFEEQKDWIINGDNVWSLDLMEKEGDGEN